VAVDVAGNLSERLKQFNEAVNQLRLDLWNELNADKSESEQRFATSNSVMTSGRQSESLPMDISWNSTGDNRLSEMKHFPRAWRPWNNHHLLALGNGTTLRKVKLPAKQVIVVNDDDYLKRLSKQFPLVRIIVLPWLMNQQFTKASANGNKVTWHSKNDTANLFVQVSDRH
jgi:LysM repeat protein